MRLLNCHVENFGGLHEFNMDFAAGCTSVCKDNGWGKSTLAAFIKIMFYGFDNQRARDDISNERKRFKPWQGGSYGGSLTFESAGKKYTVYRNFGSKEKEDVFELRDAVTNMPSNDFSANVGEELFQIDRASFERTIFWGQNDCESGTTAGINAKIGSLEAEAFDMGAYDAAEKYLQDYLNRMSPGRKTGQLYKAKEEIMKLSADVAAKNQIQIERQKAELELNDHVKMYEQLRAESDKLTEDIGKYVNKNSKLSSLEKKMNSCRLTAREYEILNQEPKVEKKVNVPFIALGIILVLSGTVMLFMKYQMGTAPAVIGLLAVFLGIAAGRKKVYYDDPEQMAIVQEKYERFLELEQKYEEERRNQGDVWNTDTKIQEILQGIMSNMDKTKEKMSLCQGRIREADRKLESITSEEKLLAEKNGKFQEELEKYKLVEKTKEYLGRAKLSITGKYMEPMRQAFEKYYEILTGNEANHILINADADITVEAQGMQRNMKTLSRGSQDLLGICIRLALVDAMYKNEKPFIIVDDPFVNFDTEHLEAGMKMLNKISEEYQVIYFTCHESRAF